MPGPRLRQPRHRYQVFYPHLALLFAAFALLWTVVLGPLWRGDRYVAELMLRSAPPVSLSPAEPRLS
jgi:hypothetical protein